MTAAHFTFRALMQTKEFWSALAGAFGGAIAAFALGVIGKWRGVANARRLAGNLAIFGLADMYSEAKAMHDGIFVKQRAEIERRLKRMPRYFEYRSVMDLRSQTTELDVQSLGFLVDSTDPDILMRLIVARNDFAAMLRVAANHEQLTLELQRRVAQADPRGGALYRAEEIQQLAGPDVIAQVEAVVQALETLLTDLTTSLPRLLHELREVLLYALPTRSFLKFIPEDRGRLSQARAPVLKPAVWRRTLRWLRLQWDKSFGPRWPILPSNSQNRQEGPPVSGGGSWKAHRWCHWVALACEAFGALLIFLEGQRINAQIDAQVHGDGHVDYVAQFLPGYQDWWHTSGGVGFMLLLIGIVLSGFALALEYKRD